MTFRAMVDSQHKSPLKKRRMQSSSDAIQQEVKLYFGFVSRRNEFCMNNSACSVIYLVVFIVYGSPNALHCSGDSDDSVCEVCQRNAEEN